MLCPLPREHWKDYHDIELDEDSSKGYSMQPLDSVVETWEYCPGGDLVFRPNGTF